MSVLWPSKYAKIRFRPGLRPWPRWGSSRRSPEPLVGWIGDTPPHILPHSAPIYLRPSPCVPPKIPARSTPIWRCQPGARSKATDSKHRTADPLAFRTTVANIASCRCALCHFDLLNTLLKLNSIVRILLWSIVRMLTYHTAQCAKFRFRVVFGKSSYSQQLSYIRGEGST